MVFFWLLFAAGAQAQPTAGAPGNRGALIANGIFGQKNVLLVTRSVFVEPLTEWIQYRRSQGWNVELLLAENRNSPDAMMMPEEIRARIRAKARAGSVDAIFIVGDGAAVTDDGPFGRRRVVPAPRVEPEVIQRFGEDESIASDSWYADFDDDAIPDAAIGRLPARTTGDVVGNVRKIIRYETGIPAGVWQRQVNFVTGVGGFSPLLDTIIQRSVRHLLSELLPGGISLTLTQADWKSVYCPDPKLFRFTVIDQINEGSLFWIYMGHGFYDTLDYLQTPEGELRIMESGDAAAVDVRGGVPILLFFACYTGAYDATVPSLAEELALRPNGPAAVVAASRTSMPYGMASLGTELLGQVFPPDGSRVDRTLGEILLAAKRNLVLAGGKQNQPAGGTGEDDAAESNAEEETAKVNQTEEAAGDEAAQDGDSSITSIRRRLDSMALMFNPAADNLAGERRDHLNLFNLLGDPLLRVRLPETFALEADKAVDAGGRLTVSARGVTASGAPANGSVRVELALPADRQALHQVRKEFSLDDRARIEFQRTFEKANRQVLSYTDGTVVNGQFSLELAIPEDLAGEMSLRAVVLDPKTTLIGSRPIHIRWVKPPGEEESGDDADSSDELF
ncbi:MAG: hypothetical protein IIZ25_07225 [Thermoguttaceae bacterium]|nr:hypothetical protein [Thermoguttaceae bacterium]